MAGEAPDTRKIRRGSSYQVDVSQLPAVRPKPLPGSWRPAVHEDELYWQRRDRFSKTLPLTAGPGQAVWPDYGIGSKAWSADEEKDFVLGIFLFEKNFKPVSRFIGNGQQKNFIQCRWYYYNRFKRGLSPLYQAFKASSLHHSKEQHVRGSLMVLGNRGRKLLSRLFNHITDGRVQDRITEAHSKMARNEISLEKFVRLLKKHSSPARLWSAFAIGQEDDLSSCYYHLYAEKSTRRSRLIANSRYRDCSTLEIQEELAQIDIRATPTNQMSDLFHMGVWPRLERLGWHLETVQKGNGRNMVYYCCPALTRFTKGAQRGIEYFDASRALLSYVAQNLSVLDENSETPAHAPVSVLETQYQGVERRGDRWRAYVMFEPEGGQSELVELGDFSSAERAAAAHDIAALKYIGQGAPRNFTHDFEQDEGLARMSAVEAAAWLREQASLPPTPPAMHLKSPLPFSPPITPRPGALSGAFSPCLSDPLKSPRLQRPAPLSLSRMLLRAAEAAGQAEALPRSASCDAMECEEEAGSPAALQLNLAHRRKSDSTSFGTLAMEEGAWTADQAAASLLAHALPQQTSSAQLSQQMAAIHLQAADTATSKPSTNGLAASVEEGEEKEPAAPGSSFLWGHVAAAEQGSHEGDPDHWWMKGYLAARAALARGRGGAPEDEESDEGRSGGRQQRGKGCSKGGGSLDAHGRSGCQECGAAFDTWQQLVAHRAAHKRFKCRTCGKGFDTLQALGGHQKTHQPAHRSKLMKEEQDGYAKADGFSSRAPGPGWLQCPTCLDWFKNGHALGGHQRVHGGQQFPPMKGIRSGTKPPLEINVYLPKEAKPAQPVAEITGTEEFDDDEVLGEIIYRDPEDDLDGDDVSEDDGAPLYDAFGLPRQAGRPRLVRPGGRYACRKCDAVFPTARGRDGHQRMHGPSAGAVSRRAASVDPLPQAGEPQEGTYEGWQAVKQEEGVHTGDMPRARFEEGVGDHTAGPATGEEAPQPGQEGEPVHDQPDSQDGTEEAPVELLPFTAARSRRTRKPRRFSAFEWQAEEWRQEEVCDETPEPMAHDGSGSDADGDSTASEREQQLFACNECTAIFPSARSLGSHRKLHRSERRKRLDELRAMSEDASPGPEGAPLLPGSSGQHTEGAAPVTMERPKADEPKPKPVHTVGRPVYGGCLLANGRYQCATCFKDFGTGQALGGHQRIHSAGPAVPKVKKAPKALQKPKLPGARKRAPVVYHRDMYVVDYRYRPASPSGSRCVVPGGVTWMDEDEGEQGGNEAGGRNRAEESPTAPQQQGWPAEQAGGDSECQDSAELLMAIHFQKQEGERRLGPPARPAPGAKPLAASPLGAKSRQWVGEEHRGEVEGGMEARALTAPASLAVRLNSEWAENVPIGQSRVFFPKHDTWQGGEKRKRVLTQLPGASSPETSPAHSPQATAAPSRFHAAPQATHFLGSGHVAAPHRPAVMSSALGLSRYGAQALHGHKEAGSRGADPRFLSTLHPHPLKVVGHRPHVCSECGAQFETGAALGGHVGKHRRESEKLARRSEAITGAVDSPGREVLRGGLARVGMSLTPRGGNVKVATARHQAPKKRIMVKFQAQQQQAAPLTLHLAQPQLGHVAPSQPQRGAAAYHSQALPCPPRLGLYGPVSQAALSRPVPLRLTVQVATSPRRAVRSPCFAGDGLPRGSMPTASPDATPRTRDVAAVLQNWKVHAATTTGVAHKKEGGQVVAGPLVLSVPSRKEAGPGVSRGMAALPLPCGQPDPEAGVPKVLSPGKAVLAPRIPMSPLLTDSNNGVVRGPASPTGALKSTLPERLTLSPRSKVN